MRLLNPWPVIGLGFVLVSLGVLLPLLMVLQIIPAGFALSFLSYAASLVGLMLGIIGSVWYARLRRRGDG
jgi:hypothetical protein